MQQERLYIKKKSISKLLLILIGALLVLRVVSSDIYAKSFNIDRYSPFEKYKSVSFKMESEKITAFLKQKKILKKNATLFVMVHWYKNSATKLVVKTEAKLKLKTVKMIKEIFKKKAVLIIGKNQNSFLNGYKLISFSAHQWHYRDRSGVLAKSNIIIRKNKQKLTIIEKRPIGTTTSIMSLSYPKWAKGGSVVDEISQVSFEGSQSLRTKILITRDKNKKGDYFPSKLLSQSEHGVNFESANLVKREIETNFTVSNYKTIP